MAVTDRLAVDTLRPSAALVVALRTTGVVVPGYDGAFDLPLDLAGLEAILAAASDDGLRPEDPRRAASGGLVANLVERRLLASGGSAPSLAPVAPVASETDAGADGHLLVPTPVLLRVTPDGFEALDHDGRVRVRLSPIEVMAAEAFRLPTSIDAAHDAHATSSGGVSLDRGAFDELVHRLLVSGIMVRFDPDHPVQARLTRRAELIGDAMRREAEVHQAFDRLEAEHDAAGGPTGRVRVIGYYGSWHVLPASLGLLIANAKTHAGGELEQVYDFRPRLLWDRSRLEQVADGPPAIFLFSHYIWATAGNLAMSQVVKDRNSHHITIHGGPDTPKYQGDVERWFAANPHVDVAVHGEGEATFVELLEALRGHLGDGPADLSMLAEVAGLSFRHGDRIVRTGGRDRIADLDTIPSPILTGLFDGFLPAGRSGESGVVMETNRGCPYGCTFCDWGSATLSRVRKFDLDRIFAELEWCARNGFGVGIADANFGIFERDVEIAERIAELKAIHGYPRAVGNNYAKNTVKHLAKIIRIFTEAGIVAEGKMSMQTFDSGTLMTVKRKNIKVEKYHDLSVEFRRNDLPLSVELMMGLPGATSDSFRNDLQACIDRDLRAAVYTTVMLPNSPMNDPAYRQENQIVARPGEEVRQTSSYTSDEFDLMLRMRRAFDIFENYGVLRQIATYVRSVTGLREIDLYQRIVDDAYASPSTWPTLALTLQVVPALMVPPVSWQLLIDEARRYVVEQVGVPDDDVLATVLRVQHALMPARDRVFPLRVELDHDFGAWHRAVSECRESGHHDDWPDLVSPLRDLGPAPFEVNDPYDSCQRYLGPSIALTFFGSVWDLDSPVSRPRQRDLEAVN